MALTEEKINLMRKRLLEGVPTKEIARELQVSERTVRNYKKKIPYAVYNEAEETGDNAIKYDMSAFMSKQEQRFLEKLEGAVQLYEDAIEGWAYHLHKDDLRLKTSGLWWSAIAYPESVSEHWIERLRATGLEVAISPLHDKDKWDHDSPEQVNPTTGEIFPKGYFYKKGDRKKAHWHIIIKSDKRMSAQEANAVIRSITNGPYVQKCRSLKNAYEYFIHLNTPTKYQGYEKGEIIEMNGFHLEPNKYELGLMQCEILNAIREKEFTEMWELTDLYKDQPEYIMLIAAKPGIYTSLLHSIWNLKNPDGKVKKIRIVKDEED